MRDSTIRFDSACVEDVIVYMTDKQTNRLKTRTDRTDQLYTRTTIESISYYDTEANDYSGVRRIGGQTKQRYERCEQTGCKTGQVEPIN